MCLLMAGSLLVHLNPTFLFLAFGSRKLFFGCPRYAQGSNRFLPRRASKPIPFVDGHGKYSPFSPYQKAKFCDTGRQNGIKFL